MSTHKRKQRRSIALSSAAWPLFVGEGVLLAGGIAAVVYVLKELRDCAQKSAEATEQILGLQQKTQSLANRMDALTQQLDTAPQAPKASPRAARAKTTAPTGEKPAQTKKRPRKAAASVNDSKA